MKRERRKLNRRETASEYGQIPQPEESWSVKAMPHLRVVDPEVVARVDARLTDRRTRYFKSLQGKVSRPETAHGKYLLSGGMLVCSTCGANFEAVKAPWKADGVYICSTRRRKPGVCTNILTVSMQHADEVVLDALEKEVLGGRYIDELLSMVESAPDVTQDLTREKERLRGEVDRLVDSIAAGVPAATVAPKIRDRERQIRSIDDRLAVPRPTSVDRERLRAALERRTEEWKSVLRTEPKMARTLLRRLLGPIEMPSETADERKKLIEWEANPLPAGMLDGLYNMLASPTGSVDSRSVPAEGMYQVDVRGRTRRRAA